MAIRLMGVYVIYSTCVIKQGNYVILVVHWKERSPGEIGGKVDLIGDSNN